jgi:transposase
MRAKDGTTGVCLRCRHERRLERQAVVTRRWLEGASGHEIAAELGVTAQRVWKDVFDLRRAGLPLPQRSIGRGTRPPSPHMVEELERRWRADEPLATIAAAVGLLPHQVMRLVKRLRQQGHDLPYRKPQRRAPRAGDGIEQLLAR